ncbi:hypothetical protein GF1_29860 [Desulfolithobacter dissulfuricans]|uniref:Uncharacterized protein n=1 Tax=Desulfolithobacter dissulfuricans TaxID=2795293 RepID=A0A915UBE0_9BACT|nr:hypothetical protein [Desulfolithobacter dissulfuricans]BCO10610.1 hypothetical protein GF1_29860 [Desulfolithobacter dissulfuricans]
MDRPRQSTIILLLLGIITALLLIARTDLMVPVMRFILDTDQGTPLQLIATTVAGILGLWLIYLLLDMVGSYYSHKLDSLHSTEKSVQGGDRP